MKRKELTFEQHLEAGILASRISADSGRLSMLLHHGYGGSKRPTRQALRIKALIDLVRCEMDDRWHELITEEQFLEHGHVYYAEANSH